MALDRLIRKNGIRKRIILLKFSPLLLKDRIRYQVRRALNWKKHVRSFTILVSIMKLVALTLKVNIRISNTLIMSLKTHMLLIFLLIMIRSHEKHLIRRSLRHVMIRRLIRVMLKLLTRKLVDR